MNTEGLFLFLILLLGLVLCSFLGGNCNKEGYHNNNNNSNDKNKNDRNSQKHHYTKQHRYQNNNNNTNSSYDNYNHYSGTAAALTSGQTFTGPNGGTITVITNSDGSQSLQITTASGQTPVIYNSQQPSSTTTESYTNYNTPNASVTTFYGPNGATATVVTGNNGQQAIQVNTSSGTVTYNLSTVNPNGYNPPGSAGVNNPPGYNPPGSAGVNNPPGYNPPGSAGINNPPGYNPPGTAGINNPPGYNPPGTAGINNPPGYNPPGTAGINNPPGYNPPGASNAWMSALPPGVPFSQIPPGDEDLYILKSQIVPPVCPACNSSVTQNAICPPCKPCGRCELPPFECKKVPNYAALSDEFQPVPVLNSFSSFGM
jgi:hypothetical protein